MIKREENPTYLNAFLDYSTTILNKSPNSIKEYNYDLAMFLKFIKMHFGLTNETDFNNIEIKDLPFDVIKKIELDDIHAFLGYLTSTFNSKSATRARKISTIRVFFKYLSQDASQRFLLDHNPALNLKTPKKDKRLPKYLSLDDSKKLLDAASNEDNRNFERDYAITTLFLNCGMRLAELVSINMGDFRDDTIRITGKGGKERLVYLNEACINALEHYCRVRKDIPHLVDKDALFVSKRTGKRLTARRVEQIVARCLQSAGLSGRGFSPHKLRHTAATLMYQGGVDMLALKEILGHENVSTTQIYTHINQQQLRAAVQASPLANQKFITPKAPESQKITNKEERETAAEETKQER